MSSSIISANRLRDGVTVWWTQDGQWAEHLATAAVLDAAALAPALEAAQQPQTVVDIHEVEVTQEPGGAPVPTAQREQIRATGPSVCPDLPAGTWGATGAILPPLFLAPAYYYADWASLGLDPPPPGFQWVRYGPDLLLVNVTTGQVVETIYDAFE